MLEHLAFCARRQARPGRGAGSVVRLLEKRMRRFDVVGAARLRAAVATRRANPQRSARQRREAHARMRGKGL
jgi:hypothetical protein